MTFPWRARGREESRKQFGEGIYIYLLWVISYRTLFSSFNSIGNLQRLASPSPWIFSNTFQKMHSYVMCLPWSKQNNFRAFSVRSTYVFVLTVLAWICLNHISLILINSVARRNDSVFWTARPLCSNYSEWEYCWGKSVFRDGF